MITISDRKDVNGKEFFTVDIDGTKVMDCRRMTGEKNGKPYDFISGPSRSYQGKDGKPQYVNMVSFSFGHSSEIIAILEGGALPVIDVMADVEDESIPF